MKEVSVSQYPPKNNIDLISEEAALAIDIIYGQAFHRKWHRLTTTMRSPGHDRELCCGLLFSLGIIDSIDDILTLTPCLRSRLETLSQETFTVELNYSRAFMPLDFGFGHPRYAGCGVCGGVNLPKAEGKQPTNCLSVDASTLLALPEKIAKAQHDFALTGGCHAAAIFDKTGGLNAMFEDVGRHNALDKLIGHVLLKELNNESSIVVLTSRASFEIVQKASRSGIFMIVAMGAVSTLAVNLAHDLGITLIGFLRDDRFNVYTHPQRILGM